MREELAEMFAEIKTDLGDLSAKITLADGSEYDVIAPSSGTSRASSEQGEITIPYSVVRMLYSDYAASGIQLGDVVSLVDCFATEIKLRIREIVNSGGIMRLMCDSVYG
jgi:hypothetical protein